MDDTQTKLPLWVQGDLDGFFGLMVDNLVQVLLIIDLCKYVAGLPDTLIYDRILPGVAVSLLIGNVFYGLQARSIARRENRPECTALPYGINTPSVIAYTLFIMGPVFRATGDGDLAWKAGLIACLVSGLIEFFGAFVAEKIRRVTPRAALLGVLASVGISFIAADFAFRIYTRPMVGMLPLALVLLAYFAKYRFPFHLPGGFLAVGIGTALAWMGTAFGWEGFGGVLMSADAVKESVRGVHWIAPTFVGVELWDTLSRHRELVFNFLTVSIPMGYINVLGSLQNIESAEAGGDKFPTAPSLAVNGIGSMAAAFFGSCFPTTIYIGHPGWKALGARSGYSIVNGLFFTLVFLLGLGPFLQASIPIEAGAAIVVFIGIVITAQAFQATPREHAPAVAIALFPGMAAMLVIGIVGYLGAAGAAKTLADMLASPTSQTLYLPGLLALVGASSSWILVTMVLSAIGVASIDRRYSAAALWAVTGCLLTIIGSMHAYRLQGNMVQELFIWQSAPEASNSIMAYRAFPIAVGYALAAVLFAAAEWHNRRRM